MIQEFEGYLKHCLTTIGIAYGDPLDLNRKTLGRLIVELRKKVDMPHDFADAYTALLDTRNTFVHELRRQDWFGYHSRESAVATIHFIERLYGLIGTCNKVLIAYLLVEGREHVEDGSMTFTDEASVRLVRSLDAEYVPRLRSYRSKTLPPPQL